MNEILEVDPRDYHTKLTFNKENIFDPDSYLSKSVIWSSYGISLWHWRYHLDKFEPSPAMKWGSLIDCITTTPDLVDEMYIVRPETYLAPESAKKDAAIIYKPWNGNATACKAWLDNNDDKEVVSQEYLDKAYKHADILLNEHPVSSKIFSESKKQVILHGKTDSGLNLKGLADLIPPKDYICDLKMCSDFTQAGIEKTIAKFGYGVQAGIYLTLWNKMNPTDQRKRFKFIFQNPSTGEVAVYELSSDDIISGQAMASYLIARLIKAYKRNYFPMLTDKDVPIISRPTWSQMQDEELLYGDYSIGKESE